MSTPTPQSTRRVGMAVVGLGGAVATTAVAGLELLRIGAGDPPGPPPPGVGGGRGAGGGGSAPARRGGGGPAPRRRERHLRAATRWSGGGRRPGRGGDRYGRLRRP